MILKGIHVHHFLQGIVLLLASITSARPDEIEVSDAQIKTVLIYNFLRFVDWPTEAKAGAIKVCIAGANQALSKAFVHMEGRQVNGRVVNIQSVTDMAEVAGCHLLYIHHANAPALLAELRSAQNELLTVGDSDDFIAAGGVIGLVMVDGRQKFKINRERLQRGSYQISAQLLKLAINSP